MGPDIHKFGKKTPRIPVKIKSRGLADSGTQMVLLGSDVLSRLGLKNNELLEMDVKVQVANGESLECLGGVLLKLSIPDGVGGFRV